jgi:hypothetical protein
MDGPGKKTKGWLVLGLECLGDCKADCVASGERKKERMEGGIAKDVNTSPPKKKAGN